MTASQGSILVKVFVVYALGVLGAMTVSEVVPQVSAIAREFHPRSPAVIGLVISLPSLVVAIGALATGFLVDWFGDKLVLMVGAEVTVLGDICVMLAPNLTVLLAGRIISGIGYVLIAVSAITLLIRITAGKQRTVAMAIWSTFVPVSFILPFLAAGAVAAAGDWRYALGGHALVSVIFLGLGLMLLPSRGEGEFQPSRTSSLGKVVRSPWPYLLGLSFTGNAFLQAGITSSLASFLHAHYGVSDLVANNFNIVGMLMTIVGCLVMGNLLNRGIPQLAIAGSALLLVAVPGFVLFGFPIGFQASIACSWVCMFGGGMLAGMWALLPSVAPTPNGMGATSGLVTQFTLLGVLLSSPVFFGAQAASVPGPMLITLGAGLLVCLFALPIWVRNARPDEIAAVGSRRLFGRQKPASNMPLDRV